MTIHRTFTDIPASDVPFMAAMIASDRGTIVAQTTQPDCKVTIEAEFPETEAAATIPAEAAAKKAAVRALDAVTARVAALQPAWMLIARGELGVAEVVGAGNEPRIVTYHATTHGGAADDSVPWCSSFVNFCIEQAGGKGTESKAARSWMTWGADAQAFVEGCVVVLQRGDPPAGHVGFFVGFDGDRIKLLGGNQSDKVGVSSFDRSRVLARRLAVAPTPAAASGPQP